MTQDKNNTPERVRLKHAILEKVNDAVKAKIDWIADWYSRDNRHSLTARWEYGREILEILEDHKYNNSKRYKPGAVKAIAVYFDEDESTLRQLALIASRFGYDEVERITGLLMADGIGRISYSHLRILASIPEPKVREDVLQKTLGNSFSAEDLSTYVRELFGGQRSRNPAGRGTGPNPPKSLLGVIKQQLDYCSDYEQRNLKIWSNDKYAVVSQVEKLIEAGEVTPELQQQVAKLRRRHEEMRSWSEAHVENLTLLLIEIADALQAAKTKQPEEALVA